MVQEWDKWNTGVCSLAPLWPWLKAKIIQGYTNVEFSGYSHYSVWKKLICKPFNAYQRVSFLTPPLMQQLFALIQTFSFEGSVRTYSLNCFNSTQKFILTSFKECEKMTQIAFTFCWTCSPQPWSSSLKKGQNGWGPCVYMNGRYARTSQKVYVVWPVQQMDGPTDRQTQLIVNSYITHKFQTHHKGVLTESWPWIPSWGLRCHTLIHTAPEWPAELLSSHRVSAWFFQFPSQHWTCVDRLQLQANNCADHHLLEEKNV